MKRDLDADLMEKWKAARESITCEAQHVKELAQVSSRGACLDAGLPERGRCRLTDIWGMVQVISQFKDVRPGAASGASKPRASAAEVGVSHMDSLR
jgi:hypothetical protein